MIGYALYYRWKHSRKVLWPIMKFSGWKPERGGYCCIDNEEI